MGQGMGHLLEHKEGSSMSNAAHLGWPSKKGAKRTATTPSFFSHPRSHASISLWLSPTRSQKARDPGWMSSVCIQKQQKRVNSGSGEKWEVKKRDACLVQSWSSENIFKLINVLNDKNIYIIISYFRCDVFTFSLNYKSIEGFLTLHREQHCAQSQH